MVKLLREWYMWDRQLSIGAGTMQAAHSQTVENSSS